MESSIVKYAAMIISLFLCTASELYGQNDYPQDSLTMSLCNNQEQIVSKRTNEWRIEYYMGETQLNMKTMSGFLSLNGASKPLYNNYGLQKIFGWVLFAGGIGAVVADGYVKEPDFPLLTLGGIGLSITGIVVGYNSNHTFQLAIRAYNRDICKIH